MPEPKTDTLLGAVLAVQRDVGTLKKDAVNPHFKSAYVPLDTIVEMVGPLLAKNGLVWNTFPTTNEAGQPVLRYRMAHAPSGETDEDTMLLMVQKADPQGQGSALTYARRYALTAYLNLVADVDDDGNAGAKSAGEANRALATAKANMSEDAKRLVSQADNLYATASGVPAAKYKAWLDSTGYEEAGLQKLVDYLTEQVGQRAAT